MADGGTVTPLRPLLFFASRRRFTQQNLAQTTVVTVAAFAAALAAVYLPVRP